MQRYSREKYLSDDILQKLSIEEKYDDALDEINHAARRLADAKITSTQLRNIYSYVKKTQSSNIRGMKRTRYLLAYLAGRESKIRNFADNLMNIIKNIKSKEEAQIFQELMEALVAYHRYYGKE